ncbi:hypothetical protein XENOCAPTIV_001642, partial [Xenoophorus captivus]
MNRFPFFYLSATKPSLHHPKALVIVGKHHGGRYQKHFCCLKSCNKRLRKSVASSLVLVLLLLLMSSQGKMSCCVHSMVISCTWTRTSLPKKPTADKRVLLRCQDNATASIVKSYGHCVVNFSAGLRRPTYRDTLRHKDTQRRQRTMTELD